MQYTVIPNPKKSAGETFERFDGGQVPANLVSPADFCAFVITVVLFYSTKALTKLD